MESINSLVIRYIKIAKEKQYLEKSMKLTDNLSIQRINMCKEEDIERLDKLLLNISNEFENRLNNMNAEEIERINKILSAKIYNTKNKADSLNYNVFETSKTYSRYFAEEKHHDMESYLNMAINKYTQLDDLYFDISCYEYFSNIVDYHLNIKINKKVM